MNRLVIFSFSLICVIIITAGLLYWYSEQRAEQKLQFYIRKLENRGITVEERSLSDFDVDDLVRMHFWSDFGQAAYLEGVDCIYFDRKIHDLYFLKADENGVKAYAFYYKRILWD